MDQQQEKPLLPERSQTKLEAFDIEAPPKPSVVRKAPSKSFGDLTIIFLFETIGTGLFAYGIVCSGASTTAASQDFLISAYLFAAIFLTCKFTGGHVNPAVSFSFYCDDTINSWTLRIYWTAQLVGAIGGAWVAQLVLGMITSPAIKTDTVEWLLADLCGEVPLAPYRARPWAPSSSCSSSTSRCTSRPASPTTTSPAWD